MTQNRDKLSLETTGHYAASLDGRLDEVYDAALEDLVEHLAHVRQVVLQEVRLSFRAGRPAAKTGPSKRPSGPFPIPCSRMFRLPVPGVCS